MRAEQVKCLCYSVTNWLVLKFVSLFRSSWPQQRKDSLGSHGLKKKKKKRSVCKKAVCNWNNVL